MPLLLPKGPIHDNSGQVCRHPLMMCKSTVECVRRRGEKVDIFRIRRNEERYGVDTPFL